MAGSTNLIPWNPTGANQETDAQYAADSQRAGGATNPSLFLAELANKAFYQWSTYLTALFQAFANKGYSTSDSNLSSLTAQCAHFLTTADILSTLQLVPYSPSITLDCSQANGFYLESMTGNVTLNFTSPGAGQFLILYYQQDGAGGRTIAFPPYMVGAVQPSPIPNDISLQAFAWDPVVSAMRAVGPLMSSYGGAFFSSKLQATSFTLDAPGSPGQVLTNVGGLFAPQNLPPQSPPVAVPNIVTGSRSFNSTYQNTTGGPIFVSGYGLTHGSTVGSVEAKVGDSSPSSTVFADTNNATTEGCACGFGFIVPNNWYYAVYSNTLTGGHGTAVYAVGNWVETELA